MTTVALASVVLSASVTVSCAASTMAMAPPPSVKAAGPKSMPASRQGLRLFAAAAENEGIAALEADGAPAGSGGIDQQPVDGVLPDAGLADAAAHRHTHRVAAGAIEDLRRDQFVIEYDVGVLERPQRLDGEQVRIAGARADQRNAPFDIARNGRARISGRIDDRF